MRFGVGFAESGVCMAHSHILLESGTNELEIVEFYIDEPEYRGYYGVNVAKVVEIIRMQATTAMPQTRHPAVIGAFPHRSGKIVPLIDLGMYLDKQSNQAQDAKIIVTEFNGLITGFKVSGVTRIHRLSWSDVKDPGSLLQNMSKNSITGVIRIEDRVIFLLDMENVVAELDPSLVLRFSKLSGSMAQTGRVYKVLHADDSGSIRGLVKRALEGSGLFQVSQSSSGEDAWNELLRIKEVAAKGGTPIVQAIQAVISDIEMPRMDGLTLCRHIKEDPELRVLPVALFSSLISASLEHRGESVGADAQFTKPDLQNLTEKVLELIALRATQS